MGQGLQFREAMTERKELFSRCIRGLEELELTQAPWLPESHTWEAISPSASQI